MPKLQTHQATPWYKSRLANWIRDSIVILAIFSAVYAWQTREMLAADGSIEVQSLTLEGIDGEEHTVLDKRDTDKPTLIYFFAPWCKICNLSINSLNGLDTQKINVVRVALDYSSESNVVDFVDKTRSEGPVLLGDMKVKQKFRVHAYPSYYLIDKNNKVVGRSMGYNTEWGIHLKTYLAKVSE